jgi:hypothetical protein
MSKCSKCGGEIIFRYVDGVCTPLHFSGGCSESESSVGSFRPRSLSPKAHSYVSYLNPNAHCPVCGVQVFFYRSPDDGRVFFDELGPPWPKHPCTDNSQNRRPSYPSQSRQLHGQQFEWQRSGWQPFICRKVEETGGGITRLFGKVKGMGRQLTLYILGESRDLGTYPMLIKSVDEELGNYQLTTFRFEGVKVEFKEIYVNAHLPEKYR